MGKTQTYWNILGLECICVQCFGFNDSTFKIAMPRAVDFTATYRSLITMKC